LPIPFERAEELFDVPVILLQEINDIRHDVLPP